MISFLLTSALLSGIGWLLYILLVKSHGTLLQRKHFIYLTICGSLCIPFSAGLNSNPNTSHSEVIAPLDLGEKIASSELQQFCNCKQPDYSHRIRYKANAFLNWLVLYKDTLIKLLIATVALIILHLIFQTLYLLYLIRTGKKEQMKIGEMEFYLLRHKHLGGIGAFQLRKKYIIWQDLMEPLNPRERSAIYLHELSHLRQRNTLEKIVLRLILCIWFFNPFHYFFRSELSKLSEFIADDAGAEMMDSKKAYAHLLLKIQQLQQLPSLASGIGKSLLAIRIHRLMEPPRDKARPRSGLILLFLVMLQFSCASPLLHGVDHSLEELGNYEEIFHKAEPSLEEAVYCTDCETICQPEEEVTFD